MKKERLLMRVSVHHIKARLWLCRGRIKPDMSLRQLASLIGLPRANPQQIKHHLDAMVRMGTIDFVAGAYVFPKSDAGKAQD